MLFGKKGKDREKNVSRQAIKTTFLPDFLPPTTVN